MQILAWDIINEPANPGDSSGDVLFVSSPLCSGLMSKQAHAHALGSGSTPCTCIMQTAPCSPAHSLTCRLLESDKRDLCQASMARPARQSTRGAPCPALRGTLIFVVLQDWLSSTSAYVKSIDPNHLVYHGTPGYFGSSTPDL